ncbi:hypothetical protein BGZ83_000594 [Gryganskiella cystojenkinii]|nr:hypothetical protein BGZ83_000594 [Gryganskiella cystojenkinii]
MTARFFCSIPDAVVVKDPYEEVFSLFTTETNSTPWAHNRSVAQQSTRLELELDYTPAPSPSVSRPGSRPDSRSSSFLGLAPAASASEEEPVPPPPSSNSPVPGTSSSTTLNDANDNVSTRVKTPTGRALLSNSRKSSRNNPSAKAVASALNKKKPVVIHQSLSTLSQPGQTGTVVWDSSILMAKFLLSIQGLSVGCYREQEDRQEQRLQQTVQIRNGDHAASIGQEQIRRLEEQAEYMSVSSRGDLEIKPEESNKEPPEPALSTVSLDPPTKRQLELHISREDQQRHHMEHPHTTEDSDEEDDGGDDEPDQDPAQVEEANNRLVFDPAKTTILELGSGCGLLGIVMVELCKDLLLTDQKPVLPLLLKNLRKNLDKKYFNQDSEEPSSPSTTSSPSLSNKKKNRDGPVTPTFGSTTTTTKPCHIQVQELVWGQELDQDLKKGLGLDYVIATDVVYNESIVPKLVDTLLELCMVRERVRHEFAIGHGDQYERLLNLLESSQSSLGVTGLTKIRRPDSLKRTVVLVAQELRTDYVHLAFLERLEGAGFKMVRIPKQMMDPDFHSGYAIYACFLKRSIAKNL